MTTADNADVPMGTSNAGMLRRSAFVTLAISTVISASCGRQVTPSPNNGGPGGSSNLSGKMLVRFRTQGQFDFANFNYVIVFNTNPLTTNPTNMPYANAFLTGTYNNFSYAFAVGASYGGLAALPILLQYYLVPGQTNLSARQISVQPSLTSFTPNSNGQGNEFTLIFDRLQLNQPSPYTPSPSPSPSLTPTPSPTPSMTPSATPSGVTPSPSPSPTPLFGNVWYINFFSLDKNGVPRDALGTGPNDNTFLFSVDITTNTQNAIFRPSGYPQTTPAAQIIGGEIDNYV